MIKAVIQDILVHLNHNKQRMKYHYIKLNCMIVHIKDLDLLINQLISIKALINKIKVYIHKHLL
jgi:hypothetical protein